MNRACLIALLCLSCTLASCSPAPAGTASAQALLTYVAKNGGVCLMRADGTHAVRLTPRANVSGPSWSPAGRYVAVERDAGRDNNHKPVSKVTVLDSTGRVRWRFGGGLNNAQPHWAPDGRHIEYFALAQHTGWLAAARPNGKQGHRIAGCIGNPIDFCPRNATWSEDGQRLAFVDRTDSNSPVSIFSTRYDGSDRRLLVANADTPAYSPVEPKLAYSGQNGSPGLWSLFVANADGGNPHAITPASPDEILAVSWSPDGKQIAFVRVPCTTDFCQPGQEVDVASADGQSQAFEVASGGETPSWSPNGKLLAFLRGRALVVAHADGTGEKTVAARVSGLSPPSWRLPVALPAAKRPSCPKS